MARVGAFFQKPVILSGAPRGLRWRCGKNGGGRCGVCRAARSRRTSEAAAHGTNGGWSVGERFFRPAGPPAEEVRGPCMFDLLAGFCLRERAKLAGAAGGMAVLPAAAPLRS